MAIHHKFWMVWNPDGRQPRYMHMTRDQAENEAKRLASENPGEKFFVLKSITGFLAKKAPVKSIKIRPALPDEIPF